MGLFGVLINELEKIVRYQIKTLGRIQSMASYISKGLGVMGPKGPKYHDVIN